MLLWLLNHIHFIVLDTVTASLHLLAIPFILLTWIILNITVSISPFEISPGLYRWGYDLPANEAYTVLTEIWFSGSVPHLYRSLPILFSWWIAGLTAATYRHFYPCRKALIQDQKLNELEKSYTQQAELSRDGQVKDPHGLHLTPSHDFWRPQRSIERPTVRAFRCHSILSGVLIGSMNEIFPAESTISRFI